MTLELPDAETRPFTSEELRLELACALYAQRRITKITGAHLAGVDFFTFQHALKERRITQYTESMLEQDIGHGKGPCTTHELADALDSTKPLSKEDRRSWAAAVRKGRKLLKPLKNPWA